MGDLAPTPDPVDRLTPPSPRVSGAAADVARPIDRFRTSRDCR